MTIPCPTCNKPMKERDRAFHCEACRETIIFFAVTDAAPFIAAIAGTALARAKERARGGGSMMVGPLRIVCWRCDGCLWVCEAHPERPWEGPLACGCGAAGSPCRICNTVEPPPLPPDFKIDTDKKGWRH
jgi:hypothetical protein